MRDWHPGRPGSVLQPVLSPPSLGSIHSLLSAPSAPLCCFPAIKVQLRRKAPGRCPSGTSSVQRALWHENIRKAAPISWPHLTRSIAALDILQQVPLSRFQPASFSAFSPPFPSCWAPLCQFSAPSAWFQMLFRQGSVERPIGCCRVILLLLAKCLHEGSPGVCQPPHPAHTRLTDQFTRRRWEAASLCRGPGLEARG